MEHPHKAAWQKIVISLHSIHEILENIMDRGSEDKVDRISEHLNLDPKDELKFLASEARKVHEIAKEVEFKLTGCKEKGRKEKCKMESMISSLMKENHDISTLLQVAITEKEAAESSLRELKSDGDQRKSAILQIAEKGLQKVGFGYIMEVISGEPEREDMSSSSSSAASNGRDSEQEVVSLASMVGKTLKNLHHEISDLRQALDESRSDCDHLHLLTAEQYQKIIKHESHIQDLEERENFLVHRVEEITVGIKEVEQEATRWREACELEVEAGKAAIKELNQEVTLLREELRRVKANLEAANSKLELKEKLAASAMAAQAAADACLKLADSRSAGLQQRIEELTRQIEQEDVHARKVRKSARRGIRYVCWPWQRLRVISASSRARTWFVDQNGRLLPGTEALLQTRI
ncbi:uncharacterized protein At3g49055 [Brachypodium distachyon]|uniref:Uncharacterized protein n=1 Tax=Brachypodium distachyon TaxID=15368 RepID=I1H1L1_BRADI|nr:uncharacterized protein At3g49055 [Brachypodium distachyon]KQK19860.1 hypothetical protein BRADI_1g50910v3 [Brachypodium distachyon]|eukprot:XP_014753302.1 uncharacterized protein At3g49055 [Brachypodium distachyon]